MNLSDTPLTFPYWDLTKVEGDIALELEVEGHNLPFIRNDFWSSKGDNSLKIGGMEYINNGPLKRDKVLEALQDWYARVNKDDVVIYESDRTSVHIHNNVQDLTLKQILQAIVAYYMLEPALMKNCGKSRKGNLFCLAMDDAPFVTSLIKKIADGDLQLTNWDTYRYASLNLGALKQFGSLEVRTMRGTYDPEFINEWAQGINSIFRRAAEEFKSPVEVFDYYYGRSQKDFLSSFVPDAFVDRLSSYDGWNERLDRNHFNLAHIVYDTDWDRPDKEHPVIEKISYNDILATSSLRSTLRQNWTDWQVDDENRDPIHEISLDDDVEKVIESLVSWSSDNFSATPEQRMKIKLYISERYLGKRESHRSNLTDGRRQDSTQVWDSTYQEWVSISSFHVNVAEKFETEFLCDEGGNYLYSEPSDFEEPEDSLDPFTTTEFTPNADLVMAEPQPQQGQLAFQDLSFWEGYTNDLQNLQTIRPVTTILPTEETF